MKKWIENWLKSRTESHRFIAWLMQRQIHNKAKKEARQAQKAYQKLKREI